MGGALKKPLGAAASGVLSQPTAGEPVRAAGDDTQISGEIGGSPATATGGSGPVDSGTIGGDGPIGSNVPPSANPQVIAAQTETPEERRRRTLLFKDMPQPRLHENVAADLELEQAERYAAQARAFYSQPLDMFPRDDWFYEDHEKTFTRLGLGVAENKNETDDNATSVDHRFFHKLDEYRKVTNDNTRKLLMILYPEVLMLLVLALLTVNWFMPDAPGVLGVPLSWIVAVAGLLGALALQGFIYFVAYDNTQTRNTLGMNVYITNKFARVTHNYQQARQHAMNVEQNMQMRHVKRLEKEAGVWALSYNWLAMRLFLSGLLIRNTTFQISRNTSFYNLGGQLISFLIAAVGIGLAYGVARVFDLSMANTHMLAVEIGVVALIYIVMTFYVISADCFGRFRDNFNADQWSTFDDIGFPDSVTRHVARDKQQILTFRDRNRFESS